MNSNNHSFHCFSWDACAGCESWFALWVKSLIPYSFKVESFSFINHVHGLSYRYGGCWSNVSSLITTMHWSVTLCEIGGPIGSPRISLFNCLWNTECVVVGGMAKRRSVSKRRLEIFALFTLFPTTAYFVFCELFCKKTLGLPNLTQVHRPMYGNHQDDTLLQLSPCVELQPW